MTTDEAARLLRVSPKTILRWARQGLLPTTGREPPSFDYHEIERWAAQRGIRLDRGASVEPPAALDALAAALDRGSVCPNVRVSTATEAIGVGVAALTDFAESVRARVLREVLDRERMASTGLGSGIAIPHPRMPLADILDDPIINVLYLSPVIDWAAPDGEDVHTAFMLLSPRSDIHLTLLSKIARAMRSPGFSSFLARQPAKAALVAHIHEMDLED